MVILVLSTQNLRLAWGYVRIHISKKYLKSKEKKKKKSLDAPPWLFSIHGVNIAAVARFRSPL